MILTHGEIGDLISALDQAIEFNESLVLSNLPPRKRDYDAKDTENAEEWRLNLRSFRKLRRKLARVEAR